MIPPRSEFLGDHVYPGMLTESRELVVVGVQRGGEELMQADLRSGDVLLLRGSWESLERKSANAGVIAVDAPDQVRRQSVALGMRAYVAAGVLLAMCVLLAINVIQPSIVVLCAAGVLVAGRVITVDQAARSVSLPTIVIIAGMIPMSTAIQTSGAGEVIADALVSWFGRSPHLLLLGIVLVILILGQFLSNLATILIVAPIAVAVAETTGVSPLPMMMAMTVAGAAAFLTPVATAGNLMIVEPGGYRFGDYWRYGLPHSVLFALVAVLLVPVIWPF